MSSVVQICGVAVKAGGRGPACFLPSGLTHHSWCVLFPFSINKRNLFLFLCLERVLLLERTPFAASSAGIFRFLLPVVSQKVWAVVLFAVLDKYLELWGDFTGLNGPEPGPEVCPAPKNPDISHLAPSNSPAACQTGCEGPRHLPRRLPEDALCCRSLAGPVLRPSGPVCPTHTPLHLQSCSSSLKRRLTRSP